MPLGEGTLKRKWLKKRGQRSKGQRSKKWRPPLAKILDLKSDSMEGCSGASYGSASACLETVQKLQTNDCSFDLEPDFVEEEKFRCLLDQILLGFSEPRRSESFRPLPPMLGNGQSVDLLKLYLLVRERGGYETVSKNGLWGLVAEESGLGPCVGSSLKLIYSKYLGKLGLWSQRSVDDKDLKGVQKDSSEDKCGDMEIDTEVSEVVSENSDHKKEDGEYPQSKLDIKIGSSCDSGTSSDLVDEGSIRKRKREGCRKMLNWIINVAKDPCDLELGSLPERLKWKSYGKEQLWKQVLLARKAMFSKSVNADQSAASWGRRLMHPSMYEDHLVPERVRSSLRVIPVKEPSSKTPAPSGASSGTWNDLEDDFGKDTESLSADSVFFFLCDTKSRKPIPVGPHFQTLVPEWTEKTTYESDSKWLGSQIWPPQSGNCKRYLIERDCIGRGRQDSCGCPHRGSIECMRFHIAEKRVRVKLELGSAFTYWKFNRMGEEVALSWTKEEEGRFQGVIKSNPPSLQRCFWDEIIKSFPTKKREELVSYYYNVFLFQRRSYQNRSTPSNIDSDDEELEFGSSTDGFRHEAGKSPSSIFYSPKKAHLGT